MQKILIPMDLDGSYDGFTMRKVLPQQQPPFLSGLSLVAHVSVHARAFPPLVLIPLVYRVKVLII